MQNNEPEILKTIPRTMEISWEALEYEHIPVGIDWYWMVGLVSLLAAGVAVYFNDPLFAIFAVIAGFTVTMFKAKGPQTISVRLTPRGIVVKERLYPYGRIESFWIVEKNRNAKQVFELSIKSDRAFMPQIIIPIGDTDVHMVREYLSHYVIEEFHETTLADVLSDYLGF